jgi:hypothetical protein
LFLYFCFSSLSACAILSFPIFTLPSLHHYIINLASPPFQALAT